MNKEYNFRKCYEQYLLYCSSRLKESTIIQKRYKFKYMSYLYEYDIRKITSNIINEYLDDCIKTTTKKYANSILKELRAFFNFCIKQKYIKHNEAKFVDLYIVPKPVRTFWEVSEYKEFIRFVEDKTDKLMFNILFYTGIRSGELTALTPAKFYNNVMLIDETYNIQTRKTTATKNNRCRECLLPDFLQEQIENHIKENNIKDNEFLFIRCSAHRMRKIICKICEERKIKKIKLHGLRHSCVSMLFNAGFDLLDVSNYIGHSNPKTTLTTYAHMYKQKMQEIKNKLEEINRKEQ